MRKVPARRPRPFMEAVAAIVVLIFAALFLAACGGSTTQPIQPQPRANANTNVVFLLSAASGSNPWSYSTRIQSLTLTDSAGKTTTVFQGLNPDGTSPALDVVPLNGANSMLAIAYLPQGQYTKMSIAANGAGFNQSAVGGNGGLATFFGDCPAASISNTVQFAQPLTISGDTEGVMLTLQLQPPALPQPASMNCPVTGVYTAATVPLAADETGIGNGLISPLTGHITSLDPELNLFSVTDATGLSTGYFSDGTTTWQGLSGYSALKMGDLVTVAAAMQPHGLLLATRVALAPAQTPYWASGVAATAPDLISMGEFTLLTNQLLGNAPLPQTMLTLRANTSTQFTISRGYSNLSSLPFPARFDLQTFFAGQRVAAAFSTLPTSGFPTAIYPAATAITLLPQTITGTATSSVNAAGFTIYKVTLPSTSLITTLQGLTGPQLHLAVPVTVYVYADGNTENLASTNTANVGVRRFRGLLFDDNGTLRMDCGRILDPVPVASGS